MNGSKPYWLGDGRVPHSKRTTCGEERFDFHLNRLLSISMAFFHIKNSSGNLNREWTLMDANNLGGDFIRGRVLCVHDLSSADCPRQHVISSRALACIRGLQTSGFHRSIRAMPSLRDLPASSL